MQCTAYATRSRAVSAWGERVITSLSGVRRASRFLPTTRVSTSRSVKMPVSRPPPSVINTPACRRDSMRSEERRVGKECRTRGAPEQLKKKKENKVRGGEMKGKRDEAV